MLPFLFMWRRGSTSFYYFSLFIRTISPISQAQDPAMLDWFILPLIAMYVTLCLILNCMDDINSFGIVMR